MKKRIVTMLLVILAIIGIVALTGCTAKFNPNGTITIVSREDGSGTRSGFDDIIGLKGDNKLAASANILNSTGAVMTKVNTSPTAIGYISLGSANETVKLVSVGGVEPSAATIKDGTYMLQRNFNLVTKAGVTMSAAAQDFMKFIVSTIGQAVVLNNKYIGLDTAAIYDTAKNTVQGALTISGSSSVSPIMEKFKLAYANHQSGVTLTVISTDSGSGVQDATNASADKAPNTIGMISRELKSSETAVVGTRVAIDGIAVIVNNLNPLTNLTIEQIRDIYSGKITTFSRVIA